jgi:Zn-dependent protease with chaperone function
MRPFIDKLRTALVKVYFWAERYKFIEIKEYSFKDGGTEKVFVFEGDPLFTAQNLTFLKAIISEKRLFTNNSEDLQNFILEHEHAHGKHHIITMLLAIPLFFASLGIIFGLLCMVTFTSFGFILNKSYLLYSGIGSGLVFLVSTLIFILISWPIEFYADYTAFKAIGPEKIEKVFEEIRSKPRNKSLSKRIINRLTHPPTKWNLAVYKRLNKI